MYFVHAILSRTYLNTLYFPVFRSVSLFLCYFKAKQFHMMKNFLVKAAFMQLHFSSERTKVGNPVKKKRNKAECFLIKIFGKYEAAIKF